MTLLLETAAELCALCCDSLTVNDNVNDSANLVKVTTQCCLEPICVKCAELACPVELVGSTKPTSYFTCGNCSGQTALHRSNFSDVAVAFLAELQGRYQANLTMLQSNLSQIETQLGQIDQLDQDLDQNMLAVTAATQLGFNVEHDQALLPVAVEQHRRSFHKTIALTKADHWQSQRQIQARLRHLVQLGQTLTELGQSLTQLSRGQPADPVTLLQLDYDLKSLKPPTIPEVPVYHTVRWFNDQLVLDDFVAQYAAAAQGQYRYRIYYPNIMPRLAGLGLRKAKFFCLVEITTWREFPSSSLPTHLSCYKSDDGYALVDQTGEIVQHCYDTMLAITKKWSVTVTRDLDGPCDVDIRYLQIRSLSRVGPTTQIALNQALFGESYPLVQVQTDQLLIWYQRSVNKVKIWTFEQWSLQLEPDSIITQLRRRQDLRPPGQKVECFYHNTVVVSEHQRRYSDDLASLVNRGNISRDLPELSGQWLITSDGSVVINRAGTSRLSRPGHVNTADVAVTAFDDWSGRVDTTPWDGRLVKIIYSRDGNQHGNHNGPIDNNRINVAMEFY